MPSSAAILSGLATIANEWRWLAIVWHVALVLSAAFVLAGWRPARRTFALMLTAPIVSVSAMAWVAGNPFNASMFALLSVALIGLAWRMPQTALTPPTMSELIIGGSFVAFGWIYPHFLQGASAVRYLYESPFGLIPCPTLSVVSGLSIVARGFESRRWSWVVSLSALLYGVIGVLALDVAIDGVLIAAGLTLAIRSRRAWKHSETPWGISHGAATRAH